MEYKEGPLIFKPRLNKQVKRVDEETGRKRKDIAKKNTSKFFVQLYYLLYGGKVNKDGRKGNIDTILNKGLSRRLSPDIFNYSKNGINFLEIKTNSIKASSPFCSPRQIENYCFSLLNEFLEKGGTPSVDYAFFRYGNSNTKHLDELPDNLFAEKLSKEDKYLTIIPLNLLFFLLAFSNLEEKNQVSSTSNIDSQKYFKPRGKVLRTFHESENAVQELIEDYNGQPSWDPKSKFVGDLNDFFLDRLKVERGKSPDILVRHYGKEILMNPLTITRYFLPEDAQKEWLTHFGRDHKRILGNLGLEDIFEDDIPY